MSQSNKGVLIIKNIAALSLVEKFRRVLDSVGKFSSSTDSKIYT